MHGQGGLRRTPRAAETTPIKDFFNKRRVTGEPPEPSGPWTNEQWRAHDMSPPVDRAQMQAGPGSPGEYRFNPSTGRWVPKIHKHERLAEHTPGSTGKKVARKIRSKMTERHNARLAAQPLGTRKAVQAARDRVKKYRSKKRRDDMNRATALIHQKLRRRRDSLPPQKMSIRQLFTSLRL